MIPMLQAAFSPGLLWLLQMPMITTMFANRMSSENGNQSRLIMASMTCAPNIDVQGGQPLAMRVHLN